METRKTARLILRPWALTDAEAVYEQARNPKIGAMCGWLPHTSVAESREIIEHVLRKPHSFAISLEDNQAIGSIGLLFQNDSNLPLGDHEAEIGYWLGEDFWGKGYATEAVQSVVAYAFEELSLARLWVWLITKIPLRNACWRNADFILITLKNTSFPSRRARRIGR